LLYLIIFNAGLVSGLVSALILIRYGIGISARIIYRTKEDLPAFGKVAEPVTQTHTGDFDEVEE